MKKIIEIDVPENGRAMILDIEYRTSPNGGWALDYRTIINPTAIDYLMVPVERFILRPLAPILYWMWCRGWDIGEWIAKKIKKA